MKDRGGWRCWAQARREAARLLRPLHAPASSSLATDTYLCFYDLDLANH